MERCTMKDGKRSPTSGGAGAIEHKTAPAHNPVWRSLATRPFAFQPKLMVNPPDDAYEQEADRVADQVLRMPESGTAAPEPVSGPEGAPAPSSRLETLRGDGRPLPGPVRTFFEPRFGRDLSAVRLHPGAALQRKPAGPDTPTDPEPSINYIASGSDLKIADAAVRDFFGPELIKGARVQASQFKVVAEEKFGKAIPNPKKALPELLLTAFLNPDADGVLSQILRHHGVAMKVARDPIKGLTSFIKERIEAGFFAYETSVIAPTDTTNVIKLTPEELVARDVKGVTDTGPQERARRQIVVQPGEMSTLVHEVVHFYTHPTYLAEVARQAGTKSFMGVVLSQALIEGVTEHFAQWVMRARQKQLGLPGTEAYSAYVEAVELLAEVTGEHTIRQAFFQGDKQAIARLFRNVDIFNRLLNEEGFSPEKIVEIHHMHEPLAVSWFQ